MEKAASVIWGFTGIVASVLSIFFTHSWWLGSIPKEVTVLRVMKGSELARSGASVESLLERVGNWQDVF